MSCTAFFAGKIPNQIHVIAVNQNANNTTSEVIERCIDIGHEDEEDHIVDIKILIPYTTR